MAFILIVFLMKNNQFFMYIKFKHINFSIIRELSCGLLIFISIVMMEYIYLYYCLFLSQIFSLVFDAIWFLTTRKDLSEKTEFYITFSLRIIFINSKNVIFGINTLQGGISECMKKLFAIIVNWFPNVPLVSVMTII